MDINEVKDYLSDDSSNWSSAEELDDSNEDKCQILCLFCSQTFELIDKSLVHLKSFHCFDLIDICIKYKLNCFQFIKLVNYIRLNKPEVIQITDIIESKVWESEDFMKPVISDDPLLMFDIESECNDLRDSIDSNDNSIVEQLSQQQLVHKLRQSEEHLKALTKQLSDMKSLVNNCLADEDNTCGGVTQSCGIDLAKCDDLYYISSYSHFSIHYEMLCDKSRTKSYENVILMNSNFFKDKTVLDIGCGTGILSLFAAKAGAKRVVAVDQSDIIYKAIDIAIENGFDSKISFIKNKVESIDFEEYNLPKKYDIIISEWMGYFLLFEGMLDTILYARNCLLNESGILLPNETSISIAGISDRELRNRFVDFWDNVYGFKMSSMKTDVLKEAIIESVSKDVINTSIEVIKDFNLMECHLRDTQKFNSNFNLICTSNEPIIAIIGWFDCVFSNEHFDQKVILSTSPLSEETHWKQTIFLLKNPIIAKIGDKIEGNIEVHRNQREIRSLVVQIDIKNNGKQVFYLS